MSSRHPQTGRERETEHEIRAVSGNETENYYYYLPCMSSTEAENQPPPTRVAKKRRSVSTVLYCTIPYLLLLPSSSLGECRMASIECNSFS